MGKSLGFLFGRPGSLRSPSGYTLYFASLVPLLSLPRPSLGAVSACSAPSGSMSIISHRQQATTIEQGGHNKQAALQMEAYRNRCGVSVKNGELSEDERNAMKLIKFFAV